MDSGAFPALAFFVALVAVGTTINPTFVAPFNVANVLTQVTPLILIAIGQSFVVGSRGLDLSVGATATLSAALVATTFEPLGPLAVPVALLGALAVGLVNGIGVAGGLHPFLMTLASLSVVQGVVFLFRGFVPSAFAEIAGYWGPVPRALPLALGVALLAVFTLRRTRLGLHILAIGGDPIVARLSGVRVARTQIAAYVLCAATAGLAGLFLAARTRTGDPLIGQGFTLDSLAAVVLGGTLLAGGRVTIMGTVMGALCLGTLATVINFSGIPTYYQLPVKGALLIAAVLMPSLAVRLREHRQRERLAAAIG